ncbi:hypothetical protein Ctob_011940 [Chrysochromulina tobinii]|uniref:Uncharacterized protein n=1 Tax=Chrysochromulina tobinii TaxID=1460289 RepID=A0A0M0JMP8_9EUKA|nr:hypothetical protein Ctob_011940 [Chrysochromulina tobinii]|eukprot:KOO27582.1 hypothetical protein Ctob_011940 [Chrysochromulina sp. CCMP291]
MTTPAPGMPLPDGTRIVKVEITLPEGANPGDKLTFCTAYANTITNFSAAVPMSKDGGPMKKISVCVPVPVNFPPSGPLTITKLTLNGMPVCFNEHRQRVEAHFNRVPPNERAEVALGFDTSPFRPRE